MELTVASVKNYLRVDYNDDDALIEQLISAGTKLAMEAQRTTVETDITGSDKGKTAVLYAVEEMYRRQDEVDYNKLMINLVAMLDADREAIF